MSDVRFALSLTQPWASAMALGVKRIETRSWSTALRGPLAIHASKGMPVWAKDFALVDAYPYLHHEPEWFPRGAIVATAILADVVPVERLRAGLSEREAFFGDYSDGRFGWIFEDVRAVGTPIPCNGALGIWTLKPETRAALGGGVQTAVPS